MLRPNPRRLHRIQASGFGLTAVAVALLGSMWTQASGQVLPDPRRPIYGEAANSQALKFADPGLDDDLLPIEINGYWGLLNQNGRVITLPRFDWTDFGVEGLARATYQGKTGFLLGNGEWRFDPTYEYADRFENGFAVFGDGKKFGYLDKAGKARVGPQFDAALRFREGWAAVRVGDRCGFINQRFEPTTKLRFTAVRSFHEGLAAVRLADNGARPEDAAPAAEASAIQPFAEEPTAAAASGVWGYLDKRGQLVFRDTAGTIEELGDFNENLARFRSGGKWGYLDRQYKIVVPAEYEDSRDFTQGMAAVKQGGKWGYINKRYRMVIPPEYEDADDFDETLAMIEDDGKFGYIDRIGRKVIYPQFDAAEPFRNGLARVKARDSFGYIKASGFVLYDPHDAQAGVVDITTFEQARVAARPNGWVPYNRVYLPPRKRETGPPPYPSDYLYDEGLAAPAAGSVPNDKRNTVMNF